MGVGRNDPCPCGSGKKYKKCCLELDRKAGVAGKAAGQLRGIAAAAHEWEADIVAMPGNVEEDPAARLALLLVAADGFVLHSEVLDRPSPEPEAMAETLATAVLALGERMGSLPKLVVVREQDVAAALEAALPHHPAASALGPHRLPRVEVDYLPGLDAAAFALAEHTTGRPGRFHLSCPETWSGWGLSPETVARVFRLAATFYRAAPWTSLENLDVLEAATPAGGSWTVCVMGNAGQEFGLDLFSEAEDFWAMTDAPTPERAFDDLDGRVISLSFEAGHDISRAMRREVSKAGWEVAGAEAYPRILAFNTPAGGLLRRDVEDLEALLDAVPRFVEAHSGAIRENTTVEEWQDEATGVVLSYRPEAYREWGWLPTPLLGKLAPGFAEGPGADPQALVTEAQAVFDEPEAVLERESAVVQRFARHLGDRQRLSSATVAKHTGNATTLVEFLAGWGVPVRAVHEYYLREFLFDWYPRKVDDGATRMAAMPGSLERFFDFLADDEGIVCPWAEEILGDRQGIKMRWVGAPDGFFWDDDVIEWRAEHNDELYARLLLPDGHLGKDGDSWQVAMGPVEAKLHDELRRRWLLWRDELLREGERELVERLIERQREWELAPHAALDGRSPVGAILAERRQRQP